MLCKNSIFNVYENRDGIEYLINTLSRSVIKLVPTEAERVKQLLQNPVPMNEKEKGYVQILIENDFLVSEEKDELAWLEYLYSKRWFDADNLYLLFLPNLKCNFICPYCFESEKSIDMKEDSLAIFIEYLKSAMKTHKSLTINFFGGEPLLKLSYIKKICKTLQRQPSAASCKLFFQLTSNAYLLNENTIKSLLLDCGVRGFQITFDGDEVHHNQRRIMRTGMPTFSTVLSNTKALVNAVRLYNLSNVSIVVRVNYDDETLNDIEKFLDVFSDKEKKHFSIYFRHLYNTSQWKAKVSQTLDSHTLYTLAKSRGFKLNWYDNPSYVYCECDGGQGQLTILPDLSVWKCANDHSYKDAQIGQINSQAELVLDEYKLMRWGEKNPFKDKSCRACKYMPLCLGSCPLTWAKQKIRNCFYDKGNLVDVLLANTTRLCTPCIKYF